jgi:hypothetical protein
MKKEVGMKKIYLFGLVIALALFSFSLAVAQDGRKLFATLTGAAEVPGPGDSDGGGKAKINLNQGRGEVCFELGVSNIAVATAAHIHEAPAGQAGPAVVTLAPLPTDGSSKGCVSGVDEDLIKRIRQNPESFYVNVHNADYPDGAVRGQLSKKK